MSGSLHLDPSRKAPQGNDPAAPLAAAKQNPPPAAPDHIAPASGGEECCCKPFLELCASLLSSIYNCLTSCLSYIRNLICPEATAPQEPPFRPASIPSVPKPTEETLHFIPPGSPREAKYPVAARVDTKAAAPAVARVAEAPFNIPAPCCSVYVETPATLAHIKGRFQGLPAEIKAKIVFKDADQIIDFHFTRMTLRALAEKYPAIKMIFGEQGRIGGINVPPFPPAKVPTETTKLLERAQRYFNDGPVATPCRVDLNKVRTSSILELLEDIVKDGHGIQFLEDHGNSSSKYLPCVYMAFLAQCGIETIFVEGIPYELQDQLDAFFNAPAGSKLPPILEAFLDTVVAAQQRHRNREEVDARELGLQPAKKPGGVVTLHNLGEAPKPQPKKEAVNYYTLKDLVISAQKHKRRVVGVDSETAVLTKPKGEKDEIEASRSRLTALNYQIIQLVYKEARGKKYALHSGLYHGLDTLGVPGLARLLGLVSLNVTDAQKGDKVGIYKKKSIVFSADLVFTPDFTVVLEESRKS